MCVDSGLRKITKLIKGDLMTTKQGQVYILYHMQEPRGALLVVFDGQDKDWEWRDVGQLALGALEHDRSSAGEFLESYAARYMLENGVQTFEIVHCEVLDSHTVHVDEPEQN